MGTYSSNYYSSGENENTEILIDNGSLAMLEDCADRNEIDVYEMILICLNNTFMNLRMKTVGYRNGGFVMLPHMEGNGNYRNIMSFRLKKVEKDHQHQWEDQSGYARCELDKPTYDAVKSAAKEVGVNIDVFVKVAFRYTLKNLGYMIPEKESKEMQERVAYGAASHYDQKIDKDGNQLE